MLFWRVSQKTKSHIAKDNLDSSIYIPFYDIDFQSNQQDIKYYFIVTIFYLIQSQKWWDFSFFLSSIIINYLTIWLITYQLSLIILINTFITIHFSNSHIITFYPKYESLKCNLEKSLLYCFRFSSLSFNIIFNNKFFKKSK